MTEPYAAAAVRHWQDAKLLDEQRRRANADHLYGVAAECGIKGALLASGVCGKAPTGLPDQYFEHVDKLWLRLPLQGLQKRFPALVAVLKAGTPFDDWSIDQRYSDGTSVTDGVLARHRMWSTRLLSAAGLGGARQGDGR